MLSKRAIYSAIFTIFTFSQIFVLWVEGSHRHNICSVHGSLEEGSTGSHSNSLAESQGAGLSEYTELNYKHQSCFILGSTKVYEDSPSENPRLILVVSHFSMNTDYLAYYIFDHLNLAPKASPPLV